MRTGGTIRLTDSAFLRMAAFLFCRKYVLTQNRHSNGLYLEILHTSANRWIRLRVNLSRYSSSVVGVMVSLV